MTVDTYLVVGAVSSHILAGESENQFDLPPKHYQVQNGITYK